MKVIYYKRLVADRLGLSAVERIVYSFLVYNSMCQCEDAWDKETGDFDSVAIKFHGDTFDLPVSFFDEKDSFRCSYVSSKIPVSKASVFNVIKKFITCGIIDVEEKTIKHNYIYREGFFDLETKELLGELLIFYSWMKSLAKDKNIIYASRKKISEMYHVEEKDIRDYLHRLHKFGMIERDEKNNLILK